MLAGCALAAKRFLGETSPITDLLWTSMFLGLLLYASRPKSIANRLFSYRPLVQLGIISYSVYLVHELVLRNITTLILNTQQPLLAQLLTIPVSLVGVFAGYVFYRCVEKPAVQYFAQRRKKAGTTNRVAAVPPSVNL
jgi:peptidoglycan/LPS O-acetylase OafA/YrhL